MLLVMMTFDSPPMLLIPSSVALKPFKVVIERPVLPLVSVHIFSGKLCSLPEFPCDRLSAHLTVLARMLNCGLPTAEFDCKTLFQ